MLSTPRTRQDERLGLRLPEPLSDEAVMDSLRGSTYAEPWRAGGASQRGLLGLPAARFWDPEAEDDSMREARRRALLMRYLRSTVRT